MINIALISTTVSYGLIQPVLSTLETECVITPYFIQTSSAGELDESIFSSYDGILISGWLLYAMLSSKFTFSKPYEVISPTEGDYYRTLFKATVEHPEIPLEQILADRVSTETDIIDVMPSGRSCRFIQTDNILANKAGPLDLAEIQTSINAFYDECIRIIRENRIRTVVTGLSEMRSDFEKMGLYFYHIYPGRASISEHIQKLINQIRSGNLADRLFVNGMLSSPETGPDVIERVVKGFVTRNGLDPIIAREGSLYRLSFSYTDFQRITVNRTDCLLSKELVNSGILDFSLGWGLGYNQSEAKNAAYKALNICKHSSNGTTFIVTENNMAFGPLLGTNKLLFNAENDESTLALSYAYDLSQLHIKQILALIKHTHNNVFNGETLAAALHISSRSARRILAKLAENGGAVQISKQELLQKNEKSGRGRPKLNYRITII